MRFVVVAGLLPALVFGQAAIPIFIGPVINFLPPALDSAGRTVAFGSSVASQGLVENTIELYAGTAKLVPSVTSAGITRDGSRAVFTDMVNNGESVGTVDLSTGDVKRLVVDTQGCIRPLAICATCFFACVATPHATADAGKILYAVRRNQPFFTVNSDGTALAQLPVYSGALAPAPQRVISTNGLVVFTSAAPFGPTFAASATDVYVMSLGGSNIRNLTNFGTLPQIFAANATISADGKTVAFETNYAVNNSGVQDMQIWTVQTDGSGLRQLSIGPEASFSPSISGDGQKIVFLQGGQIRLVDRAAPAMALTQFRYSTPQSPVISEDGSRVAFLLGPANSSAGAVWQVNSDGTGLRAAYAPRANSPRGVVSTAASNLAPSPGGLASVYGINFTGDSSVEAGAFPLPDTLAGLSVLCNSKRLPLLSVSPWQLNTQLPQDTPAQSANFQLASADGSVTPPEVANIAAAAPALFSVPVQIGQATFYQAAAFHAGTAIPADDNHPAHAGEILEMYGTGLGVTDPPVAGGVPSPADPVARARVTPSVLVGNVPAQVLFAGLTPGLAGVYQVNIVVPTMPAGRYAVALRSGEPNAGGFGTITVR